MSSPAHRSSFRSVAVATFVCLLTSVAHQQAGSSQTVDDAQRLRQQAVVHLNGGRFAEGVPVAEQAASLYESIRGNFDPGLAEYLSTLGQLRFRMADYARAAAAFERELGLRERAAPPDE